MSATVFQSPNGERSAPVADNDTARRQHLENAGWVLVSPELDAEDLRRIVEVRDAVYARSGARLDIAGFNAAIGAAGLTAAFYRLSSADRERLTQASG
jgi:hypothetical protein